MTTTPEALAELLADAPWRPSWLNTWQCGPGVHQRVMDEIELGPRVAIPWGSGSSGCVSALATPARLAQLDPAGTPHPNPGWHYCGTRPPRPTAPTPRRRPERPDQLALFPR